METETTVQTIGNFVAVYFNWFIAGWFVFVGLAILWQLRGGLTHGDDKKHRK